MIVIVDRSLTRWVDIDRCDASGCRWAPATIWLRCGGGPNGSGGFHPLRHAPVKIGRLTRPPAATPLHKEPKGSPGPPPARPDLAPGSELRIPTKWCPATRGSDGDHFRDANQDPHGTDCARHRGLQSGEVCGGLRVGSCSRTYLLIRGAGDLWRAARNPKAATRHKVCALPERPATAGPPLLGWLASKNVRAYPPAAFHPDSRPPPGLPPTP